MLTSESLLELSELNLSPKQMSGVLKILASTMAKEEQELAKEQERKRKDRERKRVFPGNSTEIPRAILGKENAPLIPPSDGFPDPSFTSPLISPQKKEKTKAKKPSSSPYSPEFEKFWSVYPNRSSGKAKAFEAFCKAIRSGVLLDTLLAGAKRYAIDCKRKETELGFIKHAATWLNGNEWESWYGQSPPVVNPDKPYIVNGKFRNDLMTEEQKIAEGIK